MLDAGRDAPGATYGVPDVVPVANDNSGAVATPVGIEETAGDSYDGEDAPPTERYEAVNQDAVTVVVVAAVGGELGGPVTGVVSGSVAGLDGAVDKVPAKVGG